MGTPVVVFIVREFPEPFNPLIAAVVVRVPVPLAVAVLLLLLLLLLLLPGSMLLDSNAFSIKSGSISWAISYLFTRSLVMARALFACSSCCLRWAICAFMNPPSLAVAWVLFTCVVAVAGVGVDAGVDSVGVSWRLGRHEGG